MALQQGMTVRAEQRLVMTAMLQQAIALLPLNRTEMQQAVQNEMLENPLLEEIQNEVKEVADGEMPELRDDLPDSENDERGEPEIDLENILQESGEVFSPPPSEEDFPSYEQTLADSDTLHEHLEWQLGLSVVPDPVSRVARHIIWNLNEQGYLEADAEGLAADLGLGSREAESALNLVQGFDPPGVGARNLQECLLLQLKSLTQSLNGDSRLLDLARVLVQEDIETINEHRYAKLARARGVEEEDIAGALLIIRSLDPYPGLRFSSERVEVVVPDVSVSKRGEEYEVTLNDDGLPLLRVSSFYTALAADKAGIPADTRKYLNERRRAAAWFVKSIEQRKQTILKVARSIVRFQKDFFDKGVCHLQPLVLRDVAEDIGMHESTVSRVTTEKYMDTPQGILAFKYFFHSGLDTGTGPGTSSVAVKERIRKVVGQEDPAKPLTDQQIVDRLEEDDVAIARRTVTKYRKELRILPASKRRVRD